MNAAQPVWAKEAVKPGENAKRDGGSDAAFAPGLHSLSLANEVNPPLVITNCAPPTHHNLIININYSSLLLILLFL